ncbi:MAG: hypothetical protein IT328_02030 [Caldilineaceae bacterium]|nr:hypothetical protein [Caldilineaceae bacterium]
MREPTPPTDFQLDRMQLRERPGCLSGLLKLLALGAVYDWLQDNIGFGRGCWGTGCGIIIFVVAGLFLCSIIFGTNWFDFGF